MFFEVESKRTLVVRGTCLNWFLNKVKITYTVGQIRRYEKIRKGYNPTI